MVNVDSQIAKEHNRQRKRLETEHEMWEPLIEDAKSRLKTSSSKQNPIKEELERLEQQENQARKEIKLQTQQKVEALTTQKKLIQEEIANLQHRKMCRAL
jgi:chromosome segregation ATPase